MRFSAGLFKKAVIDNHTEFRCC